MPKYFKVYLWKLYYLGQWFKNHWETEEEIIKGDIPDLLVEFLLNGEYDLVIEWFGKSKNVHVFLNMVFFATLSSSPVKYLREREQ